MIDATRLPRILDVVRAAKEVSRAHPDVTAWWYAPPHRLAVSGLPVPVDPQAGAGSIEIVVESAPPASPDHERIAHDLSSALRPASVSVRAHLGAREKRALFRLVSR